MLTKRLTTIAAALTIALLLSLFSCSSNNQLKRTEYLEYFYSLSDMLEFNTSSSVVNEGDIWAIRAFDGLFTVGFSVDENDRITFASISASNEYQEKLTTEESLKEAVLSCAYLLLPFYLENEIDVNKIESNDVSEFAGVILASFDNEISVKSWKISASFSPEENIPFEVHLIAK